jgi:hypothetical protein
MGATCLTPHISFYTFFCAFAAPQTYVTQNSLTLLTYTLKSDAQFVIETLTSLSTSM